MTPRKIFLAVQDNGMGLSTTRWAISMMGACLHVLRDYNVEVRHISNPYPHHGMNIASDYFVKSKADEMLIIDTDLKFDPSDLTKLLSHDVPFVSGLYTKKMPGMNFVAAALPGDTNPFAQDGRPVLREFARVAKGFLRLKREVFDILEPNRAVVIDPRDGGSMVEYWMCLPGGHSEDFELCDKWRELGGRVMVDVSIIVQHEGMALHPILETCKRVEEVA